MNDDGNCGTIEVTRIVYDVLGSEIKVKHRFEWKSVKDIEESHFDRKRSLIYFKDGQTILVKEGYTELSYEWLAFRQKVQYNIGFNNNEGDF